MNVSLIQMDPAAARTKLAAYRQQLRRRTDEEYEAAVAGYEALAAGTPLLNLADAFATTGLGEDNRPRLAIARADRPQVHVQLTRESLVFDALKNPGQWNYTGSLVVRVPFPNSVERPWGVHGWSLVPLVPADVRPVGQLRDFFVLWEVERWSDTSLQAQPDRDPYLLSHIIGDLYAVVAEWDLTELERAIMRSTRVTVTGRRERN